MKKANQDTFPRRQTMSKLKNKLNQSEMRWVRPYIAIVLAISVVLLVYSLVIIKQVREDADKTNRRFSAFFITNIENRLKSIHDYAYTVAKDSTVKKMRDYSSSEGIYSEQALTCAYDIVYNLRDFLNANGMIEDIYLYYPSTDHIIGISGSFPSRVYYRTINREAGEWEKAYEEWIENIFSDKKAGFFTCRNSAGINEIYYYYGVSYSETREEQLKVVVKLSGEKLSGELRDLVIGGDYLFAALVDGDGEIYASSSADTDSRFVDDNGIFRITERQSNYVEYAVASALWGLSFVSVQDYGQAYNLVKTVSVILVLGIVISLVVGIVISAYYANRGRRALGTIIDRFQNNGETINQNEFDYIGEQIDALITKSSNAIEASEKQARIISFSFLRDLLHRQTCSEKDMEQLSAVYGIEMENELYALVTVVSRENAYALTKEAVYKLIDEYETDNSTILWTNLDFAKDVNADIFLLNYDSTMISPQSFVIDFARAVKSRAAETASIIVSNVLSSPADVNVEWHRILQKNMPEYEVSSTKLIENEGLLTLKRFNDAVDNHNLTDAKSIVPELNRTFILCHNEKLALCRKYTLLAKMYETFPDEALRSEINGLLEAVEDDHWSERLIQFLDSVDKDLNQHIDMRQVAVLAHNMIDQEYSNPQMGLHMIADRIGVSQSYLSRLFKRRYGIGVIRYLNYVRIEQAKKLMVTSNDNLEIIAISVGFLSDVTFIRVFKKYENMTPGNFRSRKTD